MVCFLWLSTSHTLKCQQSVPSSPAFGVSVKPLGRVSSPNEESSPLWASQTSRPLTHPGESGACSLPCPARCGGPLSSRSGGPKLSQVPPPTQEETQTSEASSLEVATAGKGLEEGTSPGYLPAHSLLNPCRGNCTAAHPSPAPARADQPPFSYRTDGASSSGKAGSALALAMDSALTSTIIFSRPFLPRTLTFILDFWRLPIFSCKMSTVDPSLEEAPMLAESKGMGGCQGQGWGKMLLELYLLLL